MKDAHNVQMRQCVDDFAILVRQQLNERFDQCMYVYVHRVIGDVRSEFVNNCLWLSANFLVCQANVERMQNETSGIRKKM